MSFVSALALSKTLCRAAALSIVIWLLPCETRAALSLNPPEHFFTNVADQLLRQQLGMRLREIQIAPTNQYDSAVHRIFQVTANIYDATTTNVLPTVFRPLFEGRSNGVFLAGFTNDHRVSTLATWLEGNTYGVPLVIGAKKGLPNFNEFTLRSDFLVQRRLQLTRTSTVPGTRPSGTNQMYVLSISNYFGVEAWNSYDVARSGPYERPITISVSNFATLVLSNSVGVQTNGSFTGVASTNIVANSWQGGQGMGFILPMSTSTVFLSNAVYRFGENTFTNVNAAVFEIAPAGFPLPYWIYSISNRLTYLMAEPDGDDERIVDFVLLQGGQTVDLFRNLVASVNPYWGITGVSAAVANVWNTNRFAPNGPTTGIRQQMDIALGNVQVPNIEWQTFGLASTSTENDKAKAIDSFRVFAGFGPLTTNQVPTNGLTMVAPFNPAAKLSVLSTWQANDPLVHYHPADLALNDIATNQQYLKPAHAATNIFPSSLGGMNHRYSPWGGRPASSNEAPGDYNLSLKDPGVMTSDDWNFPVGAALLPDWLGRVHRGTPWQTIYLKSTAAPLSGFASWTNQSPDLVRGPDGAWISRTHPTNDWRMAAWFAQALNTNNLRTLTSVNTTNRSDWRDLFSGLTVLSNNLTTVGLGQPVSFQTNLIAPDAPQLETIIRGIQRMRSANRGEFFADVGMFLSVPELSVASPWLNLAGDQVKWGLNDEAFEILPSQILASLRADPVGTAILDGELMQLRFSAWDGYSYRVEWSSGFGNWETLSSPHIGVDGMINLMVPMTSGQRFFRAVLLP